MSAFLTIFALSLAPGVHLPPLRVVRLTIPHYFDFGEDRVHVGEDLVRPEAWDALRTNTTGPFGVPATRAEWERAADERPEIRDRAERIVAIARERGAGRVASYGAGAASLELWMHRLAPEVELVLTDYAPATVERVTAIFPEATVREHDLLTDAPVDADLHLFHRIDTELSNAQWHGVLRRFAHVPVLVAATEIIDVSRAVMELRGRLRNRRISRAGWLRTRAAFEALWGREHEATPVRIGDLDGWMLDPRR
jgi:hypothetical protein